MSQTTMTSLLKAQALRLKYLTPNAYTSSIESKRTAVVIAATSGIGRACAGRLAEQGYTVIAVGRGNPPGRAAAIIEELTSKSRLSPANNINSNGNNNDNTNTRTLPKHEFYSCDAFSLSSIKQVTEQISSNHDSIDVLVLTQGMATTQGFTPTIEGNDEKLTLHYYSRIAMTIGLLPLLLRNPVSSSNGSNDGKCTATVLTILSGGVHSPYDNIEEDPSLRNHYSIVNAANAAGYYNDLGFDYLSRLNNKNNNKNNIHFVHSVPGFVNTNWGQEFHPILRGIVRCLQVFGKSPEDCAEYMLSPTVFAIDAGESLPDRLDDKSNGDSDRDDGGIHILGEYGQPMSLANKHTDHARNVIWNHTCEVLEKAGFDMQSYRR